MRYLTVGDVIDLHHAIVESTGGSHGLRDLGALESALAQPKATFDGIDLHPTFVDKAAALGFSLVANQGSGRGEPDLRSVFLRNAHWQCAVQFSTCDVRERSIPERVQESARENTVRRSACPRISLDFSAFSSVPTLPRGSPPRPCVKKNAGRCVMPRTFDLRLLLI